VCRLGADDAYEEHKLKWQASALDFLT